MNLDINYIIVFGLYVVFLAWGTWKSSKEVETLSDFTTGGHRMGLILGVGTSVATWVSVASVMGVPGFLYRTGVAAIHRLGGRLVPGHGHHAHLAYKVRRRIYRRGPSRNSSACASSLSRRSARCS
jgi:sodium/pantothenate symporter